LKDGEQERYLSYYGIRRAIKDGATLEVHYIRDKVPFQVDEKALSTGYEQMCEEMELEDEEAKDFIQRQRSKWKELARHEDRINIVLDKMLEHFLTHPDPNGFKAQLAAVDRKACALYKQALDVKLRARGLPPEWSDVIISSAQNSEPEVERFEYEKSKQDELIDYFKLTPAEWEEWNKERHGEDRAKWRRPLKILIVCDRLLTGFDAPVEQVMYLDKPLRDHNLLQAIARTNRPLPAMKKRTGVIVDYFGVFANLEKALNFDESVREESLIDWEALKRTVPGELARCMMLFKGIAIEDTRACLLSALRRLREQEAAKNFEHNFRVSSGCGKLSRPTRASTRTDTNTTGFAGYTSPGVAASAEVTIPTVSSRQRHGNSFRKIRRLSKSRNRCLSSKSTRITLSSSTNCQRPQTRQRRSKQH
jgi:type I restriction enzyme R subunit